MIHRLEYTSQIPRPVAAACGRMAAAPASCRLLSDRGLRLTLAEACEERRKKKQVSHPFAACPGSPVKAAPEVRP